MNNQTKVRILIFAFVLAVSCCAAGARGKSPWIEVRSPHFTVVSNAEEHEARWIAGQFEQMRGVFLAIFPEWHVDGGKPLTVIAVDGDDSMKLLMPDFWNTKNATHPGGMYQEGTDERLALVRTDIGIRANPNASARNIDVWETENPHSGAFEDYAYSILRLNFTALPLWLRTGLAEFFANTIVSDSRIDVGMVGRGQINLLAKMQFIPFDQLIVADGRSPLYSDRDQSVKFYAESWAIVHYLMIDPEGSKDRRLEKYFKDWDDTDDAMQSAQEAFGDLKQFQQKVQNYARQAAFSYQYRQPLVQFSPKDFTLRPMSEAEGLVVEADFLEHTSHEALARPMLQQALSLQPDLESAHVAMGYDEMTQFNNDAAGTDFNQAMTLDPRDFRPLFFQAGILYRKTGYTPESTPQMIQNLEKVVQLNPNFAPGYAFLSVAYRQQPDTKDKALAAAMKAHDLEPSATAYYVDIGDALIALNRFQDAHVISDKLTKGAISPQEKSVAQNFANRLSHAETKGQQARN